MSIDIEKLTQAVTVNMSLNTAQQANGVAKSRGMELSEYIRHLITSDLDLQRQKYLALHQVFGQPSGASTFTK